MKLNLEVKDSETVEWSFCVAEMIFNEELFDYHIVKENGVSKEVYRINPGFKQKLEDANIYELFVQTFKDARNTPNDKETIVITTQQAVLLKISS